MTELQYDNGAPIVIGQSPGNLTKITDAVGSSLAQATSLFYEGQDGTWGLPTKVRNWVGADSVFDYHEHKGWLLSTASPENLLVPVGHGDRNPSVTTLAYEGHGLPIQVQDPMGHIVTVSYNAVSPGSPNLVVTLTFNDSSTRRVTLDGMGRVIQAQDERGVLTKFTYNPRGQVKTVKRAADTADERLTTLSYNDQGDLRYFDPPIGTLGRVSFEYGRYNQDGTLNGTYEGQVTRITYPDARSEFFGYDTAGELAWKRKGDGRLITLTRDALHRVTRVDYPDTNGFGLIGDTTVYDEFGRVLRTTDDRGPPILATICWTGRPKCCRRRRRRRWTSPTNPT